jgi:hypothetical protein
MPPPINTQEKGLKGIWQKIEAQVHDLLTIDVTTFSAPDVTLDLSGQDFELDELFDKTKAKIKDGSTLTLVAHTHVDFDLDAVMITKTDPPEGLMEAHNQAVQTAVEARQSFVKALKSMF